ncbi:hypothetical protein RJ639_004614 [Escallonia herrerae]|uniref:Uncharacterized protein n=1 Tax=Escallonia herrerae TaxID=1293975 RepID=A0AA88W4M1_9ASTE|nr:hypothetical protein RJ639_004614 [Escallonia herrerae]
MISFKPLPIFTFVFLFIPILFTSTNAATLNSRNNCPFTVWAGAVPGGGRQLDNGQTWDLDIPTGTTGARIWLEPTATSTGQGRARAKQDQ